MIIIIKLSFENLYNSSINDLVISGGFNGDLMKATFMNKMNGRAIAYNLNQLIDEATHYTENSS